MVNSALFAVVPLEPGLSRFGKLISCQGVCMEERIWGHNVIFFGQGLESKPTPPPSISKQAIKYSSRINLRAARYVTPPQTSYFSPSSSMFSTSTYSESRILFAFVVAKSALVSPQSDFQTGPGTVNDPVTHLSVSSITSKSRSNSQFQLLYHFG